MMNIENSLVSNRVLGAKKLGIPVITSATLDGKTITGKALNIKGSKDGDPVGINKHLSCPSFDDKCEFVTTKSGTMYLVVWDENNEC